KPRERPVSRSVATWARVTVPYSANQLRRSSELVWKGRFPTKMFLLMVFLRPGRPGLEARTAGLLHPSVGHAGPSLRGDTSRESWEATGQRSAGQVSGTVEHRAAVSSVMSGVGTRHTHLLTLSNRRGKSSPNPPVS